MLHGWESREQKIRGWYDNENYYLLLDKWNFPYNNCIKGMVFWRHEFHLVKLCMYCHPRWPAALLLVSRPRPRTFRFERLCRHNRLRPEPTRFVRLDSKHAQSDGKSVNRGLPVLDLARGHDSWCWPKGAWPLGTRMALEVRVAIYSFFLQSFDFQQENTWGDVTLLKTFTFTKFISVRKTELPSYERPRRLASPITKTSNSSHCHIIL